MQYYTYIKSYYNITILYWVVIRLKVFMQIHILVNIIEKVESRHKSVLSSKYYNKYYIFYISHIFPYYVHSVDFWTFT